MSQYFRIILGRRNKYADECIEGEFIGIDFDIEEDLENFPLDREAFMDKFRSIYEEVHPEAGTGVVTQNCRLLWTFRKGLNAGDIILCRRSDGKSYAVGEISSDYYYQPNGNLPHQRKVKLHNRIIDRAEMSISLQNAAGAIQTFCNLDRFSDEIENLIGGRTSPVLSADDSIEDPYAFALEEHLEAFLVKNWANTELGKEYDIYIEDGETAGQQYQTDTGSIDILAIRKNKKEYLVVELKKGRASDRVLGQVLRYMGYVQEEMAKNGEVVKGVIVALDDDQKIKRALSVANNIEFYQYRVDFKLSKS